MKKYLLGLFAIVLAVGFSSFTTSAKIAKSRNMSDHFWYNVDGAGKVVDLLDQSEIDEATAISESSCPDVALQPICAAAFDTDDVEPGTPVTTTDESLLVRDREQ